MGEETLVVVVVVIVSCGSITTGSVAVAKSLTWEKGGKGEKGLYLM